MMARQGFTSDSEAHAQQAHHLSLSQIAVGDEAHYDAAFGSNGSSTTATKGIDQGSSCTSSNRVSSMTSIDSNLYRQLPGYRIFSAPLEWKSASSIAQAAGIAAGHMATTQSEGVQLSCPPCVGVADMEEYVDILSTAENQRTLSIVSDPIMNHHGRFKEGSLDGITNPPNSPHGASHRMSSPSPPKDSPSKNSNKKSSPMKGVSPSKVRFEHIAEKVGIKVAVTKKEDGNSPITPPGKRNWLNVWRGGARKDSSKDDSTVFSIH
jgi:hypothetical protein